MKVYGKEFEVFENVNVFIAKKYAYVLRWNTTPQGTEIICSKIDRALTDAQTAEEYFNKTEGFGGEGAPACLIKQTIVDRLTLEKNNKW